MLLCFIFIHSSSMALQPIVGPWPPLQLLHILFTDGRTSWTSDQPITRPLPTHRTTQTQNKSILRHPCLEWDSNPWSQRSSERRQHALDRAATVIGASFFQYTFNDVQYITAANLNLRWIWYLEDCYDIHSEREGKTKTHIWGLHAWTSIFIFLS
jgi:hypothetical protein